MAKEAPISIPAPKTSTIEIGLIGDSRLVMHKWSKKAREMMLAKQMGKVKKKEFKDPEQDFKESLYQSTEGWYGFPCGGFKQAAVRGASYVGDKNLSMVKARGLIFILPDGFDDDGNELVRIEGDGPHMREDMVRISMGTADIRHRGEFRTWRAVIRVRFNTLLITPEQIVNLFEYAGMHAGIGEGRPSAPKTPMDWGMFHVAKGDEWKEAA